MSLQNTEKQKAKIQDCFGQVTNNYYTPNTTLELDSCMSAVKKINQSVAVENKEQHKV